MGNYTCSSQWVGLTHGFISALQGLSRHNHGGSFQHDVTRQRLQGRQEFEMVQFY